MRRSATADAFNKRSKTHFKLPKSVSELAEKAFNRTRYFDLEPMAIKFSAVDQTAY